MHDRELRFVEYSRSFLAKSWGWLNDPEIKKLTCTPDFTQQQQEDFFVGLPRDGYHIWGLVYKDVEIGVVGLKNVKDGSAEYFGYIGEKQYWGMGLFSSILDGIKLECKKLNVEHLFLYVSRENAMAIRAYEKNGFSVSPLLCTKQQKFMSMKVSRECK